MHSCYQLLFLIMPLWTGHHFKEHNSLNWNTCKRNSQENRRTLLLNVISSTEVQYHEFVKLRKSIWTLSLSLLHTHAHAHISTQKGSPLAPKPELVPDTVGHSGKRVIWTIKSSLTEEEGGRYTRKVTGHWRHILVISHTLKLSRPFVQSITGFGTTGEKLFVWDNS